MIKFLLPLLVCCSLQAQIVIRGATLRGAIIGVVTPIVISQKVNTFLDFHTSSLGTLNVNDLNTSAYGETNWNNLGFDNNPLTSFVVVNHSAYTLPQTISAGGTLLTSTGTKWIQFTTVSNITSAIEDVAFHYAATNSYSQANYYINVQSTNYDNEMNLDLFRFPDAAWVVSQFKFLPLASTGNNPTFEAQVHHLNSDGSSFVGWNYFYSVSHTYYCETMCDDLNHVAYNKFYDADNGYAFVHSSPSFSLSTNGPPTQGDFEIVNGQYINLGGNTGVVLVAGISVNHEFVNTNRSPWVLSVPTNNSVQQLTSSGANQRVQINFGDANEAFANYNIDIFNGASWTSNAIITAQNTNLAVINVTSGTTYTFSLHATDPLTLGPTVSVGPITITNAPTDPTFGLALWAPLTNTTVDISTNAFASSVAGTLGFTTGPDGIANHAANFTGSQYVNFNNVLNFTASDSFSINDWVKFSGTQPNGFPGIVTKRQGSGAGWQNPILTCCGQDNYVYGGISDGSTEINGTSQGVLNDGSWHMCTTVINRSGNTVKFYVDGVLKDTQSISTVTGTLSNSANLLIGDSFDGSSDKFVVAAISAVRVYTYAIDTGLISSLFTAQN